MKDINVEWIIGNEDLTAYPLQPYSDIVIDFMDAVSVVLREQGKRERFSDVSALAFWCRRGNQVKLKEKAEYLQHSLGRGIIFHVTPSNVPVNFAFSYFFGLLAGNANIVRIPSKDFPQVRLICEAIREVLERPEYKVIREGTAFVKYGHDKEVTDYFSAKADGRIIWGGDATIQEIRRSPMKAKSVEIVFADRYSLGIINGEAIRNLSLQECGQLARRFYNDTYLMDQNACSTPHLIMWIGETSPEIKKKFWDAVVQEAKLYPLEPIKAVDKYTDLCIVSMAGDRKIKEIEQWENLLYTIELEELPEDITTLRGRFGMFYQASIENLNQLVPFINERVQTLLYYGMEQQELLNMVLNNHMKGIDRIVPFGDSLNINVYWDGYDIIGQLSRRICCE